MRVLGAVQRIVERGVREGTLRPVDPVLTHLSIVGSLVFFATAGFRERLFSRRHPLGLEPPAPAAYVEHLQDMIAHGLGARASAATGSATPSGASPERARRARPPRAQGKPRG